MIVDPVGDVNNDCRVDCEDLLIVMSHMGTCGAGITINEGDTDFDGCVNANDFSNVWHNLGKQCPPTPAISLQCTYSMPVDP